MLKTVIAPGWRTEGMEMTAKGYRVFLGVERVMKMFQN